MWRLIRFSTLMRAWDAQECIVGHFTFEIEMIDRLVNIWSSFCFGYALLWWLSWYNVIQNKLDTLLELNYLKIFTKCDIFRRCGEMASKLIFKYWSGSPLQTVKNSFTQTERVWNLVEGGIEPCQVHCRKSEPLSIVYSQSDHGQSTFQSASVEARFTASSVLRTVQRCGLRYSGGTGICEGTDQVLGGVMHTAQSIIEMTVCN